MPKRNIKTAISDIVTAALCLSVLTSCGEASSPTAPSGTATDNTETSAVSEVTSADPAETEESITSDETDNTEMNSMTALEFTKLMGNGIDLGNTHEAYGHGSHSPDTDPKVFESLWGQPQTTQEIISGMKKAGFDTVRIPIAWTNAMDYESGDYTINPAFTDRIEEVVNYALNADMYVIINDHWDGSWWGMFGSASSETRDKAMEMYISMWTQIGKRFADYPDKLIFESANEELGDRLNDTDVAEDSGTLSEDECYETANRINQTFVTTVRGCGGKNTDRFLLIAGYNTDIEKTCDPRFVMPEDTAENKLMVSVHYYTPSDYCLFGSVTHWGSADQYKEQNRLLEMMKKFTERGYGVVIGEYGVLTNGSGTLRTDSDLWFNNFLDNCDLYNYVPVLWDCNDLYNKSKAQITDAAAAEIFRERSNETRRDMTDDEIAEKARNNMSDALKAAEDRYRSEDDIQADENTAVAWIMYQSADYGIAYSVGDTYNPMSKAEGTAAENAVITGAGEYTVSLDFTDAGRAKGIAFAALGIANGEQLFPGSVIDIKSILINGEEIPLDGNEYTTSDDGKCTRVNLYNQWVKNIPDDVRTIDGNTDVSAAVLNIPDSKIIKTISITFDFITSEQ